MQYLKFLLLLVLSLAVPTYAQTLSSVSISPNGGAVIKAGSTYNFTVTCAYSDNSTDNCTRAGGATWSVSTTSSGWYTVNSSGTVTAAISPSSQSQPLLFGFVAVQAGSLKDRAVLVTQNTTGDTYYQYITPQYNSGEYMTNNSSGAQVQLPLSVVVGSTITVGSGFMLNDTGGGTGYPLQDNCQYTSSNTSIATVTRHGHVTALAPGNVTITCAVSGNATWGSSTIGGWQAPGNFINLTVTTGGTSNTTWYVRPNGGTVYSSTNTTGQCDGKHDADYSGTGTNQACAAGNLRYLWADNVTWYYSSWLIQGGDTVIVRQNSSMYNLGWDNANYTSPVNYRGNVTNMPTIPSGSSSQHTRILGENYASCSADSAKTQLTSYVSSGFNVTDSQYVDIQCFKIQSIGACVDNGNYTNKCQGSNLATYEGIDQSALTAKVTYSDILLEGMAHDAIHGATGEAVIGNHVHIRAAGLGGINMDDSMWNVGNISLAGGYELDNSIIEFTGCAEEYPIVHNYPFIECRDQNLGGYGDAVGTASANGDWKFINDIYRYNYQDGLDLLHSGLNSLDVEQNQSYGNLGQTYKIGSGRTVKFVNNYALANCLRLSSVVGDEPSSAVVPGVAYCRASDNIKIEFDAQGTDTFQFNTVGGYQSTTIDEFCNFDDCTTAATSTAQNNIFFGLSDANTDSGQLPGLFYASNPMPSNGWKTRDHNLYYNVRNGCPTLLTGEICTNPLFNDSVSLTTTVTTESALDPLTFWLQSTSPSIGAGITISGITVDNSGNTRPSPPAIGAEEFSSGTPVTPPASSSSKIFQGLRHTQGISKLQ